MLCMIALCQSTILAQAEGEHMTRRTQIGCVTVIEGDCLQVLPGLSADCTAVVTDPPYGLSDGPTTYLGASAAAAGGGFMGKLWDHGVPGADFWSAVRAVCLPGAYLLSCGGTRTYHRQTCAIEDSGWIIRDCLMWVYGSGIPKSLDISKAIDKSLGVEREVIGKTVYGEGHIQNSVESIGYNLCDPMADKRNITKPATPQSKLWDGYGTALKPAYEPITLAMNPKVKTFTHNALVHGCGGLNIDGTRIDGWKPQVTQGINSNPSSYCVATERRKSGPSTQGRWPANILIDDSDDVVGLFPDASSSFRNSRNHQGGLLNWSAGNGLGHDDKGSAARFFYCAKASRTEREAGCERLPVQSRADLTGRAEGSAGLDNPRASTRSTRPIRNTHPTVKPLALMRYLLRLVTQPQRNLVLDPFAGSGTTGVACALAGVPCVLIERDAHHFEICCARVQWAHDLRARLGCTPPLDLSPYQRPPAAAAAEAQLDLWSS